MASSSSEDVPYLPFDSAAADLKKHYVGKSLRQIPTPAAVVDRAIVERNCKVMLDACGIGSENNTPTRGLSVEFRAHVKSHKTREITQLQVGSSSKTLNLIASTVAEIEFLSEYLSEEKGKGRNVNILYGLPLAPSLAHRLGVAAHRIGPGSISALIDHPSQLQASHAFHEAASSPLPVFIKVDTGYHRAGLGADSKELERLMEAIATFQSMGFVEFAGFYSHAGHSYAGDSESGALKLLLEEFNGLEKAANKALPLLKKSKSGLPQSKVTLSVGSTPTTTVIQNLLTPEPPQGRNPTMTSLIERVKSTTEKLKESYTVEVHAGNYPLLDLQQLATQVGPSKVSANSYGHPRRNTAADIAFTVLAEVNSVYEDRKPIEALVSAGTLALGREPCKAYPGWGIVGEWGLGKSDTTNSSKGSKTDVPAVVDDGRSGWQVSKISQEHGLLSKDPQAQRPPAHLQVGQKVRIWPNHACVAGAGFPWYVVVDSSRGGKEDEIVDVWLRARGW